MAYYGLIEDQIAAVRAACAAGDCPTCLWPKVRGDGREPLTCPHCGEVLGFTHAESGTWITNPWQDESGRDDVDPEAYYGEPFHRWLAIVTN